MNIQTYKIDEFLNELIHEQTSLSQQVKSSNNKNEILKNIKDINGIISSLFVLLNNIEKQKEIKVKPKSK